MADLVVIELTEVLHIHLDLVHIGDGDKAVQDDGQILGDALDGAGHVGQLADARRLNEDAVRVVVSTTFFSASRKSPTRLQQMQPEFSSLT